jgi:hypothetical protein
MDPLRTLLWSGSGADIFAVLVDGEILVYDGKFTREDEQSIVKKGAAAVEKVWSKASDIGLLKHRPTG